MATAALRTNAHQNTPGNAGPTQIETARIATPTRGACRHCHDPARRVNRPRGLCWTCYYTPGVKGEYGPVSVYGRRGVGNGTGVRPLPPTRTTHPPGSAGKLIVLEERAKAGFALWHPDDADGDCRRMRTPATTTTR